MTQDRVNDWSQEGRIYIWRYSNVNAARRGWHFTGDKQGCRTFCDLLDRMKPGDACYRTVKLAAVTDTIWSIPNFGAPAKDNFAALRVCFCPDAEGLELIAEEDRLMMTVGNKRIGSLISAFAQVEAGEGDFSIETSERKHSESWQFW